jgi:serine/threonine protein kinase
VTDPNELEYRERLQRALGPDYTLGELIGRGGFGSVYKAVDRKLDREVAVKALRHDLFPTPLVLERFEREAKAVAKLRHANILPVYAVGAGEGVAYMIMPVIHGSNLQALTSGGKRVDPATTVRIISEVARALEAAHRLGVVHRDVKPENILLEGDDQHALLSDFGIAKSANEDAALTGSGMVLGSPPYMSPEQASAEGALDGRSDIYSLGAVAYEMLAGRRPYDATSFQQMVVMQFTTEPKPLREVAPEIPVTLADTVMRALERDRERRWPSAGEFAAALTRSVPQSAATVTESGWFARRGLIIALLYYIGIWTTLIVMPLMDVANSSQNNPMGLGISLLQTPMQLVVKIGLVYLVAEFFFVRRRLRRSGLSWPAVRQRLFLQPSWWQPWYPRRWRDPSSAWDRMSWGMKSLRTILWLCIPAGLFALPILFVVPRLVRFVSGEGMPLALPFRLVVWTSHALRWPLCVSLAMVVAGVFVHAAVSRVQVMDVVRLLFTWRAEEWETPAGRRLQRLDLAPRRQ